MESPIMSDFAGESYQLHGEHYMHDPAINGEEGAKRIDSWFDETSADFWRQARMYDIVNLLPDPDTAKWLTVGDGRYGTDSIALRKRGIKNVLPSDISEYPLKCALERNLITDYAVENAEKLSFADDAFDYVMCKEAYHHFPRPYIALYEMLRVAKQAVLLIEPNDYWMSPLGTMAFAAKRLLGRARHVDDGRYEDSGNYVYSVSQREMEKLCLGMDVPQIAFKGLNDVYISGGEFAPARWSSRPFLRMRGLIAVLDGLCRLRLFKPTRLMVCIFKRTPPPAVAKRFRGDGWQLVDLPRNPYRAR
jgi:ubiquinone/menaquinone biosynthesis C-methylase UbiE